MTSEELSYIKRDLASFADDEFDLVEDGRGTFLIERNGNTIRVRVFREDDDNPLMVEVDGEKMYYRTFLAKRLANLDLLASKMIQYNPDIEDFVNSDVEKRTIDGRENGKALDVLLDEARTPALVGTKVSFVTADAGHGKSVLLRHLQFVVANKYLKGEVPFLFWHIDLHGRDLVRLNEAIMYEANKLRVSGLFYSTILTLIRRRLIVLGIDGFDELAAEIGGETALGSLSNMMSLLEGRGTLIAASRRAFFNSQDYIKRTGTLKNKFGSSCEFNEIRLQNWKEEQCKSYLEAHAFDGSEYDIMAAKLGATHPLLERPYLFTKLVGLAFDSNIAPSDYLHDSPLDSINEIIEAFVRREVEKWTAAYDAETGSPYLTYEQHIRLLSEVAREMWMNQNNMISAENIQVLLALLFEDWNIDESAKPKIMRLVESHAFLVNVPGRDGFRQFDHEEFKNYFLAKGLRLELQRSDPVWLRNFLSSGQLPDAVSQYLVNEATEDEKKDAVNKLVKMAKEEWKPSYVHPNIGTLLPYLLNDLSHEERIEVEGKILFSSLVFEDKSIENVTFRKASFINISFHQTRLKNVRFEQCSFSDMRIYERTNAFENVQIDGIECVNMVSLCYEHDERDVEYSPDIIRRILTSQGISFDEPLQVESSSSFRINNIDYYSSMKRLLNKYAQTGYLYESSVKAIRYNNTSNPSLMINDIIPLLIKYNIIKEVETKKTQRANTRAWTLSKYELSEVLVAEEDASRPLFAFWEEVRAHE